MQIPGKLVVRTYAPARRWIILGSVAAAGGGGPVSWPSRWDISRRDSMASRRHSSAAALQSRLAAQDQTIHELRVQLAADASAQVSQVRERTELARTIGELQAGPCPRAAGSRVLSRDRQSGRRQPAGIGAGAAVQGVDGRRGRAHFYVALCAQPADATRRKRPPALWA